MILQVLYYNRLHHRNWRVSTYRDAMGVEVDLVIETETDCLAVEIKSATKLHARMFKSLSKFDSLSQKPFKKIIVYLGQYPQKFDVLGDALPYQMFLEDIIPSL